MKRTFWDKLFKREYILNKKTGEMHTFACPYVKRMAPHNIKKLTKRQFMSLYKNEQAEGCTHCLKEFSKD